jgi:hypothetical protein
VQPEGSLSAEQWLAVLERLGFYRWVGGDAENFFNSDRLRRKGPPGVYLDCQFAEEMPIGIVRRYLVERGFDEDALDAAIAGVQ